MLAITKGRGFGVTKRSTAGLGLEWAFYLDPGLVPKIYINVLVICPLSQRFFMTEMLLIFSFLTQKKNKEQSKTKTNRKCYSEI